MIEKVSGECDLNLREEVGMAISLEIRERIAHSHEHKLGTYAEIAEILGCGVATVSRVLRRKRETGSVAAKRHAGGMKPKIDSPGLKLLDRWLKKKPDFTLAELTQKYNACSSTKDVSRATVGRAVFDRLGLRRKKRLIGRRKGTGKTSFVREKSSALSSRIS